MTCALKAFAHGVNPKFFFIFAEIQISHPKQANSNPVNVTFNL